MEDGKPISESLHRHVIVPGDNYSNADTKVQTICAAVHTPEIIAAYSTKQANLVL
jgi:hypothetical protein